VPAANLAPRAWRLGFILAAVAVGMAIGGLLAGGFSGDATAGATEAVGPDVGDIRLGVTAAGPFDKIDGVGVGFNQSEEGAVAAATNLILTLEQAGNTERNMAVRSYEILAAEGSKEFLKAEMAEAWDALHGSIVANGPARSSLFLRTVPVGHQLTRYSNERATVEVWTLTIVAASGMTEPLATWETATVEVVWEADDWKVWSARSAEGPSPAWAAEEVSATDPFLISVDQMEGYRYVAD